MDRTRTKRAPASHQQSPLLNHNENARVHNKLLRKQQALQTAVVQLVRCNRQSWIKEDTGALVIMKDSTRRSYYLTLYSIGTDSAQPIWEQEIYTNFNVKKSRPFFLQFSATDQQMGINFADDNEAEKAFRLILEKAAKKAGSQKARVPNGGLQVRPLTGGEQYNPNMNKTNPRINNMGNMNNQMSSSTTSIDSGFGTNDKKNKKDKDKMSKTGKGRLTAADISAPDTTSFQHLRGVQIGPMGQMSEIGNTSKNDPHMKDIKSLLQDMKIAQNEQQAEEMLNDPQQSESIYQFIDQRGGINKVKQEYRNESVRRKQQPARHQPPPPAYFNKDPPPVHVKREITTGHGPPPPPVRNPSTSGAPPPPQRRESINTGQSGGRPGRPSHGAPPGKTPPPPPGGGPRRNLPPPPPQMPANHLAPPPPYGKPRGPPPSLPEMPPPPPYGGHGHGPPPPGPPSVPGGNRGPPPPPGGRSGPPPPPPPTSKPAPPGPPPPSMKPAPSASSGGGDARNAFLDQIHKGKQLKSTENSSRENTPRQSIHEENSMGLGMAEQLKLQLSQIRTKVDSDEEEVQGADDDEWDDEWDD